jgi:hypothetical protein
MNPEDIILCNQPRKLKVSDVRKLLLQKDDTAREYLADLILHRLRGRFITPLENVFAGFESGFLMMAASCLMIETFQCFKNGEKDTRGKKKGEKAFVSFFQAYSAEFPGIDGLEFYHKIRCGILHQAQTHGHFRILLERGAIFDEQKKTINASAFLKKLKTIVESYVKDLRSKDLNDDLWVKAINKIGYICDACEDPVITTS